MQNYPPGTWAGDPSAPWNKRYEKSEPWELSPKPQVSTPDEFIGLMENVLDICENDKPCEGCPIFCRENNYMCAAYIAKLASEVNWDGYETDESGTPLKGANNG